jgi:hypothetical protein
MEDEELKFLRMIGMADRQIGEVPDFIATGKGDIVKLVMRSKLEKPKIFGQWAVITISSHDFVNMANNFQATLLDLKKREKKQG